MRTPALAALAASLLSLAPLAAAADAGPEAPWSLTVQGWAGGQQYDGLGLRHAVATNGGRDLLDGTLKSLGVSAVLRVGWLDLGLLYDGSVLRSRTDSAVITPLVGFRFSLSQFVRLDVLGELGGHEITNVGLSDQVDVAHAKTVWIPYAGLRPTLSFTTPVGPVRAVFSAAPYARWDLTRSTVNVQVAGTTTETDSYRAGGVTYGLAIGAGIEL